MAQCLCDKCIKEYRYGALPGKHYIPSKLSKLERKLYKLLHKGELTYLDTGRHRDVYLSLTGKSVIKFPISYDGIEANLSERTVYLGNAKVESGWAQMKIARKNLAGCRMIGPNVLIMTKVNTNGITDEFIDDHAPRWVEYIDSGQVGFHPRTGKLVAFDYTSF